VKGRDKRVGGIYIIAVYTIWFALLGSIPSFMLARVWQMVPASRKPRYPLLRAGILVPVLSAGPAFGVWCGWQVMIGLRGL
jgi:hypothetical protein